MMGGVPRRIHTQFEKDVIARLERIERLLEQAGLHIPCLLDKPPEDWTGETALEWLRATPRKVTSMADVVNEEGHHIGKIPYGPRAKLGTGD